MRFGGLGTSRPREEELVPGATGRQLELDNRLCSWGLYLAQPGEVEETGACRRPFRCQTPAFSKAQM